MDRSRGTDFARFEDWLAASPDDPTARARLRMSASALAVGSSREAAADPGSARKQTQIRQNLRSLFNPV